MRPIDLRRTLADHGFALETEGIQIEGVETWVHEDGRGVKIYADAKGAWTRRYWMRRVGESFFRRARLEDLKFFIKGI